MSRKRKGSKGKGPAPTPPGELEGRIGELVERALSVPESERTTWCPTSAPPPPEENAMWTLRIALQCAVPMAILELERLPWEEVLRVARESAQVVAEKGDVIQFRAKGTAAAFGSLARGIAALAFCPGGVTFLGDHWEAKHAARAA